MVRAALRCNPRRAGFVAFFRKLPPTEVDMEACGGSHHEARELRALGHAVALIPAQHAKPFVRRGKTDAAEAICTAAEQRGEAGRSAGGRHAAERARAADLAAFAAG